MYEHYRAGRFGNALRTWKSQEEMVASGYTGKIGLRYSGATGGSPLCAYHLNLEMARATADFWFSHHAADPSKIVWCEAAADEWVTFQGEIIETDFCGYALHYSTLKKQMRPALAEGGCNHLGPGALLICKQFMDGPSYENLRGLLADFPGHCVEFSCYSKPCGPLRWNTVFWETRLY